MLDLDLLSCFPKNGQESLEGSGGINLSRRATMEERESKRVPRVREPLGKKGHLNRRIKNWPLETQIPAGPVVPAQRAVLPPHTNQHTTAHFENPHGR